MRSRMGDSHLGRTVLSSSYAKMHFPIKLIVLAGQPCHPDRVIPTEWSFLSWVFSHPLVDIFSTRANAKLPLCVSPVLDFMGWEEDFFPFALLRRILLRILSSENLSVILVAPLWSQEGVVCQHSFSSGGCLLRDLCHGTGLFDLTFGSFTGVWSRFVFMLGNYPVTLPNRSCVLHHRAFGMLGNYPATLLNRSCVLHHRTFGGVWHTSHQGKWPRILHWYHERNVTLLLRAGTLSGS